MQQEKKKVFFDVSKLRRIFQYAAPYKSKFYWSIFLALFLAALTPVRPLLIQLTVDKYIAHSIPKMVVYITIIQMGIILLETAMRFVFSFITAWLGQAVVKDMRVAVYKKVLGLNLRQFDRTPIGTLTTRTINDIESINEIFSDGLIPILADLLSIICVLAYMFWVDWQLTFIALIPFPIMMVATYYFKESINKSFFKVRNAVASLNAYAQEHLSGMSVVQAFAAERNEFNKFKAINKQHRNANISAIFAYSIFFPVIEIVLALSIGLVVWFTAKEALDLQQSQQGVIVSFILCLNLLFRPLRMIADKFNTVQMGVIASDRVFTVLDNDDEEKIPEGGYFQPDERVKGKIDFKEVHFAYTDEQWVLKNVSFEIEPGQTVAIVGHTGSGKTTIISLLNRFYNIQKGGIEIDGTDIRKLSPEYLRENIGVVLQDVFLFSGSIMDNITLRNPHITKDQVVAAAKMIDMHEFIMRLPGGYDYNVKERGATLSLGQRQLLSFIRALLYDPSILVLDEATSSIDTESELLIQKATDKLIQNRTSIVIAHRLSTIRKADKILVLDKGQLMEAGTHNELLAKGGFYAKLHQMQFEKEMAVNS
ncbi:ABC transporter ATP-binding protein [Niabella ginsengisoli]|uniref:ABC transporter ATP-binding protein/permease n=1 Tax=Niabella ginsengisoli TaxID=522298 RepID=A0ABS9SPY7_9BACT|nr:ABC transporter ATP-binding protein [Niabella ginsengisoli]MCH5600463.1 ABC transporter ATP-binding protein/permease [Niabella ginsengisoli]